MGRRGRHTQKRENDLGAYIEKLRLQRGWNVRQLADVAKISNKTLSKIELGQTKNRRPGTLWKIARALEEHPDHLLVLAQLTPYLHPVADIISSPPPKEILQLQVTSYERRQLENYLQFLRYVASAEALYQSTDNKAGMKD
jgi:transcriptional regulator with XRE-family HTH domain